MTFIRKKDLKKSGEVSLLMVQLQMENYCPNKIFIFELQTIKK